jgi:hypothetical protein
LDRSEFSQGVLTTVVGAVALAVIWWIWNHLSKRPLMEWITLSTSRFEPKNQGDFTSFGCVSVLLSSRSAEVIKGVTLVVSDEVAAIHAESGVETSFVEGSNGKKIVIAALQPKKDATISLFSSNGYISVDRVLLDHVEIEHQYRLRISKFGEIIVSNWVSTLILPIIVGGLIVIGASLGDESQNGEATLSSEVEQTE